MTKKENKEEIKEENKEEIKEEIKEETKEETKQKQRWSLMPSTKSQRQTSFMSLQLAWDSFLERTRSSLTLQQMKSSLPTAPEAVRDLPVAA